MRYAYTEDSDFPRTVGVEPQLRNSAAKHTIEITSFDAKNVVVVNDKTQLKEIVWLLNQASVINGWGELD